MISASHNPYQDNGIKFFDGDGCKITQADEKSIEQYIFGTGGACKDKCNKNRVCTDEQSRDDYSIQYVESNDIDYGYGQMIIDPLFPKDNISTKTIQEWIKSKKKLYN